MRAEGTTTIAAHIISDHCIELVKPTPCSICHSWTKKNTVVHWAIETCADASNSESSASVATPHNKQTIPSKMVLRCFVRHQKACRLYSSWSWCRPMRELKLQTQFPFSKAIFANLRDFKESPTGTSSISFWICSFWRIHNSWGTVAKSQNKEHPYMGEPWQTWSPFDVGNWTEISSWFPRSSRFSKCIFLGNNKCGSLREVKGLQRIWTEVFVSAVLSNTSTLVLPARLLLVSAPAPGN